jgi:hypothetical protein
VLEDLLLEGIRAQVEQQLRLLLCRGPTSGGPERALSRRSICSSFAASIGSNSGSSHRLSNEPRNISTTWRRSASLAFIVHSSPPARALADRFALPTQTELNPVSRWKSQAFAWMRLRRPSKLTRTSAPFSLAISRIAAASVAPV